jgi:nitroreductase
MSGFTVYQPPALTPEESLEASRRFRAAMQSRRSVRSFSDAPVPKELIRNVLMTAAAAPSGANKQPWTFCAVGSPDKKRQIRHAAEREEYQNYTHRMSEEWLADLRPLGTDWQKPFLEIAPWLIVVFKQAHGYKADGSRDKHYYVNESVGLATGFLLAALHEAGLASLTHTPSPMNFLGELLERPSNERPYLLIPVGYPAPDAQVPEITRKSEAETIAWYE